MALTLNCKGHMHMNATDIKKLAIDDLRTLWKEAWGHEPHIRLGRVMMEVSLLYKQQGVRITPEHQARLNQLVAEYKRNPKYFDNRMRALKPGTRLVRVYNGKKHSVLVKANGFEYNGQTYSSLSKIANEITGSHWNGRLFFGLRKN